LTLHFFGLTRDDLEDIILEPFFLLTWHIGMDWNTYYHYPVAYKKWLIERLAKELSRNQSPDLLTSGPVGNTPQSQTMNSRMKRFSM
jgi:hypothetical protein